MLLFAPVPGRVRSRPLSPHSVRDLERAEMRNKSVAFLVALATILLVANLFPSAAAAAPSGGKGGVGGGASVGDTGGAPALATTIDVHGGYVAAGVGLRNRGFGTIKIAGIPKGATVV